jgi:hypothetical protein
MAKVRLSTCDQQWMLDLDLDFRRMQQRVMDQAMMDSFLDTRAVNVAQFG